MQIRSAENTQSSCAEDCILKQNSFFTAQIRILHIRVCQECVRRTDIFEFRFKKNDGEQTIFPSDFQNRIIPFIISLNSNRCKQNHGLMALRQCYSQFELLLKIFFFPINSIISWNISGLDSSSQFLCIKLSFEKVPSLFA